MSNYDRVLQVLVEHIDDDAVDNIRGIVDEREIRALALSIQTSGIEVPVILMPGDKKPFRLLDGWRRIRAAKLLGLKSVPAIVRDKPLCAGERILAQLIINCQRCDIDPVAKSRAIKALMEETGWNGAQTAKALGMSESGVTRALSLLSLEPEVQSLVQQGRLSASTAHEIARLGDRARQLALAREAANGSLTRDGVSLRARHVNNDEPTSPENPALPSEETASPGQAAPEVQLPLQRFRAVLPNGAVTVACRDLTPDSLIGLLADLLGRARKLKSRDLAPAAFFASLRKLRRSS